MQLTLTLAVVLVPASFALGQVKEEFRLGVRLNTELYPQATVKQTMTSLVLALDKERFDYILAHFIDPAYVDRQLRITAARFNQAAAEQVASEGLDKKGFSAQMIRDRQRDLAFQMNFEHLARRLQAKLVDDPESVKELRKLAREGDIQDGGDAATIKHKDIKDRALFLRNLNGRWHIDNKMTE